MAEVMEEHTVAELEELTDIEMEVQYAHTE
jgi:hypothetical protein